MERSNLILVLLVAAAMATAGRRWKVPYLQSGVRVIVGVLMIQFARGLPSWRAYLFAVLGLLWIGLGASDIWKQRARQRTEEN